MLNFEIECKHAGFDRDKFKTRLEKESIIRDYNYPWKRRDGTIVYLKENAKVYRKNDGTVSYYEGIVEDVTERKKAEEERNQYSIDLKERMKELNCLYSVSEIVRREDISQEEILKLCPDMISQAYQFPEITACRIIWGDDEYKTQNFRKTQWSQSFSIMVNGHQAGSIEVYCIGGKDQECYDDFFLAEERNLLKNIADLLGRSAERKQAEEQIKHLATHDPLTDLPTLRLVEDRLAMAIELAKRNKKKVAVLFIDLDGFKNVNDTLGHDAGDYLLKTLAQHFLTCIRKTDTISRIGGDEFLLIAGELKSVDDAAKIAQKVLKLVSRPVQIEGQKLSVSASIGIAFYPDHSEDINALIKLSDEAMYRVKNSGKNGFAFVDKTTK
jgi:diguanylate cyclase (GGDEF)-like protein